MRSRLFVDASIRDRVVDAEALDLSSLHALIVL